MVLRIMVTGMMDPNKASGFTNGRPGKSTKDALPNAQNMDKVGNIASTGTIYRNQSHSPTLTLPKSPSGT